MHHRGSDLPETDGPMLWYRLFQRRRNLKSISVQASRSIQIPISKDDGARNLRSIRDSNLRHPEHPCFSFIELREND